MAEQASFTLRNRNPDILTCIANLSNDEVFTPPDLTNQMLDMLTEAWAKDHNGENIWENKDVKFLDPCTKSGVFLREITSRLTTGLEKKIPNLEKRVDHILSKQVYGIGITKLTSLLARRSVYCSKNADGEHSIAKSLKSKDGNIWYENIGHTWLVEKCKFCGASKSVFERDKNFDTYAYKFIHSDCIETLSSDLFGEKMEFDVIIGNPPYQLNDAGESTGASPIYQYFVNQAKLLSPKYISMIIPSRWFAGGKGLDSFRKDMLDDSQIRKIVDFTNASDVFPGVDIAGGVCYFLWKKDSNGECEIVNHLAGKKYHSKRVLNEFHTFIRYGPAVPILRKIISKKENSLSNIVSSRKPFGLATNVRPLSKGDLTLVWNGGSGPYKSELITTGNEIVHKWKVITSKVSYDHGGLPNKDGQRRVFSKLEVLPPGSICTETYIVAGSFDTELEAKNTVTYLKSKFVRFLVSLLSFSQDITKDRFFFVPELSMKRAWTDEELYKRYDLTEEEIEFIESTIKSF